MTQRNTVRGSWSWANRRSNTRHSIFSSLPSYTTNASVHPSRGLACIGWLEISIYLEVQSSQQRIKKERKKEEKGKVLSALSLSLSGVSHLIIVSAAGLASGPVPNCQSAIPLAFLLLVPSLVRLPGD